MEEIFIDLPNTAGRIGAFVTLPDDARALIAFAHGSGSSRHSSRNQFVAEVLNGAGFATLVLDLLTPEEERVDQRTREHRFDIPLLARRVVQGCGWAADEDRLASLPLGLFGSSTGAAAAIIAAAEMGEAVAAVVSRGGRPDLAGVSLGRLQAPLRCIVGSRDDVVIRLNKEALEKVGATKDLLIVEGATHLFEEPGTLDEAARGAADWFSRHLTRAPGRR